MKILKGGLLKVGIFVPTGIGDGLVLLKAAFAIKHIYGAQLVFFEKFKIFI